MLCPCVRDGMVSAWEWLEEINSEIILKKTPGTRLQMRCMLRNMSAKLESPGTPRNDCESTDRMNISQFGQTIS